MWAPTGTRARRGRQIAALLLAAGMGCSSQPAGPSPASTLPILPGSSLPGYTVRTEPLGAATIAAEVADPASVAVVLEQMESGIERRFSSRRSPEQQVVSRTIRFASSDAAVAFVAWLEGHPADVLGAGPQSESVPVDGAVAFSHDPNGCCPGKEMVWWLVAWSRGADAFVLMVGGAQVRSGVVRSLAATLDEEAGA